MSLTGLLTHAITTYRLQKSAGIQTTYQPNLVNQPCLIQPVSPEYAQKAGLEFGKTYNCFVPINTDVTMTDKIIDQDGYEYRVAGLLNRNYGRNVQHMTILMNRQAGKGYEV